MPTTYEATLEDLRLSALREADQLEAMARTKRSQASLIDRILLLGEEGLGL